MLQKLFQLSPKQPRLICVQKYYFNLLNCFRKVCLLYLFLHDKRTTSFVRCCCIDGRIMFLLYYLQCTIYSCLNCNLYRKIITPIIRCIKLKNTNLIKRCKKNNRLWKLMYRFIIRIKTIKSLEVFMNTIHAIPHFIIDQDMYSQLCIIRFVRKNNDMCKIWRQFILLL